MAELSVKVVYSGELELLSEKSLVLGAVDASASRSSSVRVRFSKPGQVELRASVEGLGPSGEILFHVSYPLYFVIAESRVLVGVDGFSALELAELNIRKKGGEVTEEEYERIKRRIHSGGATESITVTPPAVDNH